VPPTPHVAATQPVSAQPMSGQPASAQPASAEPAPETPPGPYAPEPGNAPGPYGASSNSALSEPTQVVPQHDPANAAGAEQADDDRTQIVGNDRPGYGPADQDPPRS
jgi:hypothetical protein